MATNTYAENDANDAASLSRHFLGNESDDENDEFKKRLKEAIPDKSARAFALRAGLSPSGVRQYLNGENLPTLDKLRVLAKTANVNLLWLATGEGPKHPQTRGSPDSVQEKSADYVCDAQKGWIRKAVEAVEIIGKDAPAARKAVAVEQVYGRLVQSDGAADMIEVMRIIQAALEG
ncbi:MAG: helix-turn-helix transcriptional regulator [Candidatus Competibacter sp.]|nr:helix-turn-helix transcriptional regulator [Candidatus Competibacter sp.]